jgi:hypothetical protein
MDDSDRFLKEQLKDPEFAEEREHSKTEYEEMLERATDKWLRLEFDDTAFSFIIRYLERRYADDNWFVTELNVQNQCFNYTSCGEVFMFEELHHLKDRLAALLNGNLEEETDISFIEPDFEFVLTPIVDMGKREDTMVVGKNEQFPSWQDMEKDGITQYVREGYELIDISLDLKINLHNQGCYNGQQYLIPFSRAEIDRIYEYLETTLARYPL